MAEKQVRKIDDLVQFYVYLGSRRRLWSRNLQKKTGLVTKTLINLKTESWETLRREETFRKANAVKNG